MTYKYVVRNTAKKHGKVATFMPKPIFADNGSGMHVHQSIWKDGKNLFSDPNGYAGSERDFAKHYIGGLLKHGPALLALAAPTVNSLSPPGAGVRSAGQPRLLGSATARPRSASRSTPATRRASGSSSAARTRPRTRTCSSRRC